MAEWRNGGMAEWRNGGMAEWRNGGMAEWQSGIMYGTKYYGIKIWKVHRCLLGKAPLGLYQIMIPTRILRHRPNNTHYSTMASAALPSPAGSKMMKNNYIMAQATS
jgi:hypothetical protein